MTTTVRAPIVAGRFYPADPAALADEVDALLDGAPAAAGAEAPTSRPVAIVAPHAAYRYSGAVAARAWAAVRAAGAPARAVLAGPAHFVPIVGCAVPAARAWRTPLGDVEIDGALLEAALAAGCAADDGAHVEEHAVEVQLPFLQRIVRRDLAVLPVAVGVASPGSVAGVLAALADAAELLVVSTDLSHDLDRETAERHDRRTAEALVARDAAGIREGDACGLYALRGMAELARRAALDVRLLALGTSADADARRERVVGYGAFSIHAAPSG